MKLRLLPVFAVFVVTVTVIALGYGLMIGLVAGLVAGAIIGFTLGQSQKSGAEKPARDFPAYAPETAQAGLEAFYLKARRSLTPQESATGDSIYHALLKTLEYLPDKPVKGASELWETAQREFMQPTLQDLRSDEARAEALRRIEARCVTIPETLRSLATTLLPAGTSSLRDGDNSTFYLDNLRAMPPIRGSQPGNALDNLAEGDYFRIGDEVFLVKERLLYKCGRDRWHEVLAESLKDGMVRAVEWEWDDHQIEILLQEEAPLGLHQVNLSLSDLRRMDDDEEGSLQFRGEQFVYDESDKATCHAVNEEDGDPFYYYDFIGTRSRQVLGVERWGSEHKAYLMRPVSQKDVELLSV
jgi:hypothetical protein